MQPTVAFALSTVNVPNPGIDGSSPAERFGAPRRGMLDQSEHPAGHEPRRADDHAGTGDLVDLEHPAPGDHLVPAPGAGGGDLVGLRSAARIDHDLDPVTL